MKILQLQNQRQSRLEISWQIALPIDCTAIVIPGVSRPSGVGPGIVGPSLPQFGNDLSELVFKSHSLNWKSPQLWGSCRLRPMQFRRQSPESIQLTNSAVRFRLVNKLLGLIAEDHFQFADRFRSADIGNRERKRSGYARILQSLRHSELPIHKGKDIILGRKRPNRYGNRVHTWSGVLGCRRGQLR